MTEQQQKTFMKKKEQVVRQWFVLDAAGKTLGRFAAEVAKILRGKHRPDFTPHVDCGDGVIVINADKIYLSGSKRVQKMYRYYTGSMSGLREIPFEIMQKRHPNYAIEHAVKGMLPKNSHLSRAQMTRLRVYAKGEHDLDAQNAIQVSM